jgi:hypothetical protein
MWCEHCKHRAREQANRLGWRVGVAVAIPMAIWIFGFYRPEFMLGGWIGVVVGGLWLGKRIGTEVLFASYRSRWGD